MLVHDDSDGVEIFEDESDNDETRLNNSAAIMLRLHEPCSPRGKTSNQRTLSTHIELVSAASCGAYMNLAPMRNTGARQHSMSIIDSVFGIP